MHYLWQSLLINNLIRLSDLKAELTRIFNQEFSIKNLAIGMIES
ncbi:hypothetical protein NIES4101_31830 [Calothrix sp. NIES-4101]|nr:hypothetical protein NIES4101_31830 [Calothrix sp. NIES-4101]